MEGLASQIIVAGVGSGILAIIGLTGVIIMIFVRLGRVEKSWKRLETKLTTTQENLNGLQRGVNEFRREMRDALAEFRREVRDEFTEFRQEIRKELKLGARNAGNRRQRRR